MGKEQLKSVLLVTLSALVMASCTKKIPYKNADIDTTKDTVSKSLLGSEARVKNNKTATHLYSASLLNASRSSADALPYSAGDSKRVALQLEEKVLRIVEVERDGRFSSNTANNKTVLEIPVEHVQFECEKDKYGECTNKEAEAKDIPWEQRNSIRLGKIEDAKTGQLDLLPIMISQTLGENCYDAVSAKLLGYEITSTSINIDIERTFKAKLVEGEEAKNSKCKLDNLENGLTDAAINAVFHYSLVRLDSSLSKDYKVVSYPDASTDESKFGFFSSKSTKLDIDNNRTLKSTVQVMNRWNPNRTELTYYLSDEFDKPENKLIKQLTKKAVENVNAGLKISGVNFRINLNDPAGKNPGDIRNSMIVLVEDPVASSVIGYGPQTEDPVTGEIISARTVMFLGTIKKFIGRTYDEILEEKKNQKLALNKSTLAAKLNAAKAEAKATATASAKQKTNGSLTASLNQALSSTKNMTQPQVAQSSQMIISGKAGLAAAKDAVKNYRANVNTAYLGDSLASQLRYMNEAKNCAFTPAGASFSGGISESLMAKIDDDAKPWKDLSDGEKETVLTLILPEIWIPTLVHELGHNLGLRHNFEGSEDKANFYNEAELKAIGSDHQTPFSSVMDYGNDLKTLTVLGKYDIAALKFGYLRQVEVVKPDQSLAFVNVDQTLTSTLAALNKDAKTAKDVTKLKEYGYCTDENVGVNAGCKRFDLGTNYVEITQNIIDTYETDYLKRNFRNDRYNMSLADDDKYASRMKDKFMDLRLMMEVYERVKYIVGDKEPKFWDEVDWAKDLKQAALMSGAFLTNVLLTPDTTCAFVRVDKPTEVSIIESLSNINTKLSTTATSCFDIPDVQTPNEADEKNPIQHTIIGQTGKSFNHIKAADHNMASYEDQIDVRGIWIDKIVAANMLLKRKIGSFNMDKHTDNFINIPELRQGIMSVLVGILNGNINNEVMFNLVDGSKAKLELNYDLFESHKIEAPPAYSSIAKVLNISAKNATQFQQVLAQSMATNLIDNDGAHDEDRPLAEYVMVSALNSSIPTQTGFPTINNGSIKYVAGPTNKLAQSIMANYQLSGNLGLLKREKLIEIYTAKTKKQVMPQTVVAPEEKFAWGVDEETLKSYLTGEVKSPAFYMQFLGMLPQPQ